MGNCFFFLLLAIRVSVQPSLLAIILPLVLWFRFSRFQCPQSPSKYRKRCLVAVLYCPSRCILLCLFVFTHSIQNHNLSVFMARGQQNMGAFHAKSSRNLCWWDAVFSRFLWDLYAWVSLTRSWVWFESAFNLQRLFQSFLLEFAELSETSLPHISSALTIEIKPSHLR